MNPIIITEYDINTRTYIAYSCIAFREDEKKDEEGVIKDLIKKASNNSPLPQLLNVQLDNPPNKAPLYVKTDLVELEIEYIDGEYLVKKTSDRVMVFKSNQWPAIKGWIVGRVMVDYYMNKELKRQK